jgi:hypothetical protein
LNRVRFILCIMFLLIGSKLFDVGIYSAYSQGTIAGNALWFIAGGLIWAFAMVSACCIEFKKEADTEKSTESPETH